MPGAGAAAGRFYLGPPPGSTGWSSHDPSSIAPSWASAEGRLGSAYEFEAGGSSGRPTPTATASAVPPRWTRRYLC